MQEETNNALYQRRQNVWNKKSIYILKLLPKHVRQITKCQHFRYYMVVEHVGISHWVVCLYSRARVCV